MRNGRIALACVVVAIDLKHQHVFWPQTHASRFSRSNVIRPQKFLPPSLRLVLLLLTLALAGCASHSAKIATSARPFNFHTDTFAYANSYTDAGSKIESRLARERRDSQGLFEL